MSIFNYKNFFKKKEEEEVKSKNILTDEEKFNVDNYNEWFNTIYSGYSGRPGASGIFLRTDKLSDSMISDWFVIMIIQML